MERLRPEDDYFFRCESDDSPMHIGALQLYDRPEGHAGFAEAVREHLERRLAATPLARLRRRAPLEFDAALWCDVGRCDLARHVEGVEGSLSRSGLLALVEDVAMRRLDLEGPPFHVHVVERLEEGGAALVIRVHHAVADGLGFQHLMGLLTDATPDAPAARVAPRRAERPPAAPSWLVRSALRFAREGWARRRVDPERERSKAALRSFESDPAHRRVRAVRLARSVPTSPRRRYETLDLPLSQVRATGRALGGTVNDVFLALAAGALRRYLAEAGELPDAPLVAVAARSYRREEHGPFGNRILNLMPSLATDVADPVERLAAIRRSMAVEIERSRLVEGVLREEDRPFGARKRRREFEQKLLGGRKVLPGHVVLSNVPGPAAPRYLAGHRLRASYPAPVLGYGRLLNVTLRRYEDALQCGIMSDAEKIPDVERIRTLLVEALEELTACARDRRPDTSIGTPNP